MKVKIDGKNCTVTREDSDKKIYRRTDWADPESTFLHDVKKELNNQGYDFIKKRMYKDGHLVDDRQQYLKDRNPMGKGIYCIHNGYYAVFDAGLEYNKEGVYVLRVEYI
jgi:hypothetical protein